MMKKNYIKPDVEFLNVEPGTAIVLNSAHGFNNTGGNGAPDDPDPFPELPGWGGQDDSGEDVGAKSNFGNCWDD